MLIKRTLYLLRHAQSHITNEVHHSQWPLSPKGREQAQQLIDVLSPLGLQAIVSSPFKRCIETATPFAQSSGLELTCEEDVREHQFADGVISDFTEVWRQSWSDFDYRRPDGESSRQAQTRMLNAVTRLCRTSNHETLLVSSHGNVIALLVNALGESFGMEQARALRNPDVLRFHWNGDTLKWDQSFRCNVLDTFATDYAETPVTGR